MVHNRCSTLVTSMERSNIMEISKKQTKRVVYSIIITKHIYNIGNSLSRIFSKEKEIKLTFININSHQKS